MAEVSVLNLTVDMASTAVALTKVLSTRAFPTEALFLTVVLYAAVLLIADSCAAVRSTVALAEADLTVASVVVDPAADSCAVGLDVASAAKFPSLSFA